MTWVEKITVVPLSASARIMRSKLALIERVEAGERLVEHDEARLVHQRAKDLHLLRHALRHLPDLPVGGIAKAMLLEQFAPAPALRRVAARAGRRQTRSFVSLHRGIEAAFFGKIADGVRHVVRTFRAQHPAMALVGVDDPQEHAQGRGLARAVGAEDAVDRAFGHGEIDPIDGSEAIEPLDESARLDCQWSLCPIKVFVDTAPVMEKPLGRPRASAGRASTPIWVSREFGSWLFLGAIFTTPSSRPTPERTIAARAAPASTPARPRPFRRPTSSMRGAAFPT
jgi:hypothetical protein